MSLTALMLTCGLAASPAARGLEIARVVDQANSGYGAETSTMEMKLINAHGDETRRKMQSVTREFPGDGDRARIEFLWPADVKGTRLLTWNHKSKNDDQWLFLPDIGGVRRISARSKTGSFMGSEFSYEDLGGQELERYTYSYIEESTISQRKIWVSDRFPVDKKSGYSRQRTFIDQGYMNPIKVEYFDRKGELLKTAEFSGYTKFGKYWRAATIHMVNHQTQKQSWLIFDERKLGKLGSLGLEDDVFDHEALED